VPMAFAPDQCSEQSLHDSGSPMRPDTTGDLTAPRVLRQFEVAAKMRHDATTERDKVVVREVTLGVVSPQCTPCNLHRLPPRCRASCRA
jgi:hypothetical protein